MVFCSRPAVYSVTLLIINSTVSALYGVPLLLVQLELVVVSEPYENRSGHLVKLIMKIVEFSP